MSNGITPTLHMGIHSLSKADQGGGAHYVYTDSTEALWTQSPHLNYSMYYKRISRCHERAAYGIAKHIFTTGEHVRASLLRDYGIPAENVTAVGTGLGGIQPYSGPKAYDRRKILFVAKGRFEDKGGPMMLNAFRIIQRKDANAELIVVGQPDYLNHMQQPGVRACGYIPFEELQALFNQCTVFAMPALYEPWGLVYLEALATRMPIIGLRRNAFPEISGGGQYGLILDDVDPQKVADAIYEFTADAYSLSRMGEAGQRYVLEKYTWGRVVDNILAVIFGSPNEVTK